MTREEIPYYALTTPCDIAYRKDSPRYPVGPHTHNAAELYLTHTALPDVLLDDIVSKVPAGSLILIPPFCVHQLYHELGVVYERYILSVHQEWLAQIFFGDPAAFSYLKAGEKSVILPLEQADLQHLTDCFQKTLSAGSMATPEAVRTLITLLEQIDLHAKKCLPEREAQSRNISDSQKKVNEMILYINEHLNDRLSLADLANHFYMNADYLGRLFKSHMHTSVGHYIAIQKITKAQLLLKEGSSITQIQEQLGYSSYAHFAKTFKKLTGMTPGQYQLSS